MERRLRWLFDEREIAYRGTPFAIDWVLLVTPLFGGVGFVVGWFGGLVAGVADPVDLGLFVAIIVGPGYVVAVPIGTAVFRLRDRVATKRRRLEAEGPFEAAWAEQSAAALSALGVAVRAQPGVLTSDLWSLIADRPRAVVMAAFARVERDLGGRVVPEKVRHAFDALQRLQQLAVFREAELPAEKARAFLQLCDLLVWSSR
jgi:hypothetical protein